MVVNHKVQPVEYINESWYWVRLAPEGDRYYTNSVFRIKANAQFKLGTKSQPYLTEQSRKRLEGKATDSSQEEEVEQEDQEEEELEDTPIGDQRDDESLATAVMSSTQTAYARGGGAITLPSENPMNPPAAVSTQIQALTRGPVGSGSSTNTPQRTTPAQPVANVPAAPAPAQQGGGGGGGAPGGAATGGGGGGGGGAPGGGGGGGGPAGAAPPAQAQAPGRSDQKRLEGNVDTFDGDRSKSLKFEKDFGLYRLLNAEHPLVAIPAKRVCLALSYIKGDKVDRWAHQYADHVAEELYTNNVDPQNEALWNNFVIAFRRQFQDTAEKERAWANLQKLEMKGRDIDGYIAEFENLLKLAGRNRDNEGAVDYFKDGLLGWLQQKLLERRPIPRSLDDWQWMAREEIEAKALIDASLGTGRKKGWLSSRQTRWESLHRDSRSNKGKDPDAMDVDRAKLNKLSIKERAKLSKEGKCFLCKEKGHMARACPKKASTDKGKQRAPKEDRDKKAKARTASISEEEDEGEPSSKEKEAPPEYSDDESLKKQIRKMTAEKREALLEELSVDGDF